MRLLARMPSFRGFMLAFALLLAPVIARTCEVSTDFNARPIAAGHFVWFNAEFNFAGLNAPLPKSVKFSNSTIDFTVNGNAVSLPVPDALITYDPHAFQATTRFDRTNNQWVTVLPTSGLPGDAFLTGLPFRVPRGGLPGGISGVTWKGIFTFTGAVPGTLVNFHWAAAVYSSFTTQNNLLGVKPVDSGIASQYANLDSAGTPEAEKAFVIAGGTGAGGTNFTGRHSPVVQCPSGGFIPPEIASCTPTSSLSALISGSTVTAYIPNGAWSGTITGLQVVPIEPAGTPASVATPSAVNSCAANSATGQAVCTANTTDVYLISGTTLTTTLKSGATASTSFSGGSCQNCGIAINQLTNTAVIAMGLAGSPSGSGLQFLDLGTNAFSAPVPAAHQVSEDVLWDPSRNLILSPNEAGVYDLFDTSSASATAEFSQSTGGFLDSAAEDCTTGIALASDEFTGTVFISDLTQAAFTAGSPGSWTAPGQFLNFPEFASFSAGTDGIAVAPGSHLAVVTGEFGGNQFGVLQLPDTSGSGTPGVVDYAAATLPPTPDGFTWEAGLDPHTVTAYVSPSSSTPIALMANSPPPKWIAVVDMQAVLAAPRTAGSHNVDPSYDLIANGVVKYISTH